MDIHFNKQKKEGAIKTHSMKLRHVHHLSQKFLAIPKDDLRVIRNL